MTWIIIALIGHAANGFAFVIDKILLKNAFKRSATYAGMVGLLSGLAIVLIPWVTSWPIGVDILWAILCGITFMAALWTFFAALSRGEASRVVPIISALIPVMTLIGAYSFLGERLSYQQLIGFALLIVATILLAGGKAQTRLTKTTILLCILSALMFAVSAISGKAVYDSAGFLGGFVTTRIVAAATALILACLIDPMSGAEMLSIIHAHKGKKKGEAISGSSAAKLAVVGQVLGGIGFILLQYAISLGSASIVNALQVMQFALLVIIAFVLKSKAQTLLGESLKRNVIALKAVALVVMAVGLAMISL
ncbi:MAG: EamA family transporter [Patescibacteria group bacterium]|nr:EamA family transporter [Patescibacteria group bacterium]